MDNYPGMYDATQQETDDIMHDYLMMLPDFGPDDKDVKAYRAELEKRGVMQGGHPLCPDCGDIVSIVIMNTAPAGGVKYVGKGRT